MNNEIELSTPDSVPVAPSMDLVQRSAHIGNGPRWVNRRSLFITGLSLLIALVAALVAEGLIHLIGFITNLAFYGKFSACFSSPAGNSLGIWVIAVPIVGGIIVGGMARYGHIGIRGHGIPEAMEQILTNQSRIPPSLTFLKPVSAAISIGTGGPFGAEGPIIATGGALGSVIGQLLETTADERKTLLAAGAAAGMAATFGSPLSAVLLAIDLLLFEFRASSFVPVALASTLAAAVRIGFHGANPIFAMPGLAPVRFAALGFYVLLGTSIGLFAVGVTKAVYFVEDSFEHFPIHWMWWPAIGGLAVGIIGYFSPRTLGVGYSNIDQILSGTLAGRAVFLLCAWKFISWAIALGSGTSGGTLAPIFTVGGGLGSVIGLICAGWFPHLGIDSRVAALVGMAALFTGASRALLTSVVFAFETTGQPLGLLPLLGGCSAAYLVSSLLMKHTIMTEKIARRGIQVPTDYTADFLSQVLVSESFTKPCVVLRARDRLDKIRAWIESGEAGSQHQGFPVVDAQNNLVGVVTRRDLMNATLSAEQTLGEFFAVKNKPAIVIFPDNTLRDAADLMVQEKIGRLPVVDRLNPNQLIGVISRSDVLSAHSRRLRERHEFERTFHSSK